MEFRISRVVPSYAKITLKKVNQNFSVSMANNIVAKTKHKLIPKQIII